MRGARNQVANDLADLARRTIRIAVWLAQVGWFHYQEPNHLSYCSVRTRLLEYRNYANADVLICTSMAPISSHDIYTHTRQELLPPKQSTIYVKGGHKNLNSNFRNGIADNSNFNTF